MIEILMMHRVYTKGIFTDMDIIAWSWTMEPMVKKAFSKPWLISTSNIAINLYLVELILLKRIIRVTQLPCKTSLFPSYRRQTMKNYQSIARYVQTVKKDMDIH